MGAERGSLRALRILLRWRLIGLTAACAALLAAPAAAQAPTPPSASTSTEPTRTYVISGMLRLASTNQGADMIRVELKRFTGESVNTAFTNSTGQFEFGGLTGGEYVLEVIEEGYEPIRESIELRGSLRAMVTLYLRAPLKLGQGSSSAPSVPARELALSPKAAEALQKGRQELFDRKNPAASLKHFQRLAKEAPDFFEAHYFIALALAETGRSKEAEDSLRLSIQQGGESHALSLVTLASMLSNQQRFAESEPLARKAVALDPDAWPGHFELARSLLGLNRADEAHRAAQAALEKKKDSPDLHLLLADICIRREDAQGLLAALDAYLALQPQGPMSDRVRATRQQLLENMAQAGAAPAPKPPPPKD